MNDLFKGLEDLGFDELKIEEIYAKKKNSAPDAEKTAASYTTSRRFSCPVCDRNFENHYVRLSKIRLVRTDTDLRPYYEPLDPLYYDVVLCPHCGYAAMSMYFTKLAERQADIIRTSISPKFKPKTYPEEYTVDIAIERYKLALLNTVVKNGNSSEKAYTCLKLSWLFRDKRDDENEMLYLKNALEGFRLAYSNEVFPMCGMDEHTFTYLLGELCRRCGELDEAMKYISKLIIEKDLNPRLKSRATDVKDLIREDRKRLEEK